MRTLVRRRRPLLGSAALLLVVASAAVASSAQAGPSIVVRGASSKESASAATTAAAARRLGLPPGGPAFLYTARPNVPQLQNRDARFRAPFNPVSGTERYTDGEYAYTDFLYDDAATTYPDFKRYAGNAGDLAELRISTRDPEALAVRFTLNTLVARDSTILVLAFDSDRNVKTGSSTLPRDPGMAFPGTDQVLTTWGTGAQWSRWTGTGWAHSQLAVRTDTEANQITVTVPRTVARPSGTWRATLATGLYDRATGGWLAPPNETTEAGTTVPASTGSQSKIVNLGFRFNEVPVAPPTGPSSTGANPAPYTRQNEALAAGEPTRFAHDLDFGLLQRRGARSTVPTHGLMYRIFASRLKTVMVSTDGTPANGNPHELGEGKDVTSLHGRYLSPLQPYALYVPRHYDRRRPAPLTFSLHGDGGEYFWLDESSNYAAEQLGEGRNSIVLSPAARGVSGFYVGDHEFDVLEAWNDVAHSFALDPVRTAVTGYSMGGHGSYRLGLLYPHLFARAVPMAPAICRGLWYVAKCSTTEDTVANHWVENARNLPIFHIADMFSELTFYPGQAQQAIGPAVNGLQSIDSLGYRYRFWSVAQDHLLTGTNHPQVAAFLGHNQIEPKPFHVTYARMPSNDLAKVGLVHNRAYWLSGIELRDANDPLAKGVVDAVSLGFGLSDPTSQLSVAPGVTAAGWAYVETQRTWSPPGKVPVQNRITLHATNVRSVTIDTVAAHVDCNVKLDVQSDGPLQVTLLGCP
jgi:hypothetical protein